jgi:N-acyl-D-amino-acid deacylase
MMPRRVLPSSAVTLLLVLLAVDGALLRAADGKEPPITGRAAPRLKHLDQVMLAILRDFHLPGGSLAVARNGRLVFARGYGWADQEDSKPVRPDSRFNLASCGKPITAAAVLKLVDQGKLRLDARAFVLLGDLEPPAGQKADPRLRNITVRQLLHHAGGLVRDKAPTPRIAQRLKVELPITLPQAVGFSLGQPLLFNPGSETKYSNLGFLVLRLIVERTSGVDYETFTARQVLGPMGIRDAHLDLLEGYRPREVRRYAGGKRLPGGHGPFKGGGCWVLSTTEAVRFLTSLDGSRGKRVLSEQAYARMLAPLPSLGRKGGGRHNGLGWDVVERTRAGVRHSKNGGVPGICTYVEHLPDGVCWAAFFNGNLKNAEEGERTRGAGAKAPWPQIRQVLQKVERWPAINLFESE